MAKWQQEKYGWEFLFLGANIDAVETAAHMGIAPQQTANYHSDSEGTALNYEGLSDTVCAVRAGAPLGTWYLNEQTNYEQEIIGRKKSAILTSNG